MALVSNTRSNRELLLLLLLVLWFASSLDGKNPSSWTASV
jgi:hypothetical protein